MCVRPFGQLNVYYICPVCKEMHNGCSQCLDILDTETEGAWTCTSCGRLFCAYCYHNFPAAVSSGTQCDKFRCPLCAQRCSSTARVVSTTAESRKHVGRSK
jgi:hypothetical protein